ncbi:zinc finger CCCH domain-containing protein 3 [Dendroctonus ponderosae]|nr:zinc finger CCCH domain-containing protein 3 [Dendroctonus ponderosae]KAH1010508.1 hypothetical protein HUJ05_004792 [Dendroctonus ponderosae]
MENYPFLENGNSSNKGQFPVSPIFPFTQMRMPYSNNLPYGNVQFPNVSQKVLINPRFQSNKVFVNPNFPRPASKKPFGTSIYVNPRPKADMKPQTEYKSRLMSSKSENVSETFRPNAQIHINPNAKAQSIFINPRFTEARAQPETAVCATKEKPSCLPASATKTVYLSKTKLIRAANTQSNKLVKRRHSVKSKYKIVKSEFSPKPLTYTNYVASKTKFKLNNTSRKPLTMTTSEKKLFVKTRSATRRKKDSLALVNISGILFKKSRNSIRRASMSGVQKHQAARKTLVLNTNSKLVKKMKAKHSPYVAGRRHSVVEKYKVIRRDSRIKSTPLKIATKKLRKCNIPCPTYRKFGVCKRKDKGKCSWKHNPDQIALCTRFLQGACIKEKCLLSHNVSSEKMPTCKYYLEGTCSKDLCPYLHVKINSKAEVCRDFLEGFCKKAAQCNKRHQYLCPDYEKHGTCLKQRCAYPHGKMVRSYCLNKNKFVKKCSEAQSTTSNSLVVSKTDLKVETNTQQCNDKRRYYVENRAGVDNCKESSDAKEFENDIVLKNFVGLEGRPKLGSLPSFILLETDT